MAASSTRRGVSPVFGQLYVSSAVLAFAALFVPLWTWGDVEYQEPGNYMGFIDGTQYTLLSSIGGGSSLESYSLWRGIVVEGEGIALLATLLVLVLVVLAVLAAQPNRSLLFVGALLVLGIVALVMLAADPGKPSAAVTGPGAGMLWGAALVVVVTSAVHLWRSVTGRPVPVEPVAGTEQG